MGECSRCGLAIVSLDATTDRRGEYIPWRTWTAVGNPYECLDAGGHVLADLDQLTGGNVGA